MPSSSRLAGIVAVSLAACGPAGAQELAPPGSGVSVQKVAVTGPFSHTVKYYVKGGSPRLQALVRRVEWAENELSVIEQLQQLKIETVVNERRVAAARTAQITNPYSSFGLIPPPVAPGNGGGTGSLQRALTGQLEYEATSGAALELIGYLEQVQTDLDAELKALPAEELKVMQGPVDALRPRVAALPHGDAPAARPQPGEPRPAVGLTPVVPKPVGTTIPLAAPPVRVPAPAGPPPFDVVAFQEQVRKNQEQVRQGILQTQQLVMQRHQAIVYQHQLLTSARPR